MKKENNKKHPPKINDECYSEIVTDFSKILNKYNLTSKPKEHIEILKSVIDVVFYSEESPNFLTYTLDGIVSKNCFIFFKN